MWIQRWKLGCIQQISENDIYGYASSEAEAEQHAAEYPFLFVLGPEDAPQEEYWWPVEDWPAGDKVWPVFAADGAEDWFAGKPHLCAKCVVHDCATPEWNHYVSECPDYKPPQDIRYTKN